MRTLDQNKTNPGMIRLAIEELALNEVIAQASVPLDNELPQEWAQLIDEGNFDYFNLPESAGYLIFENQSDQILWKELYKLSEQDRKLLMFTALGSDPSLIAESLGFTSVASYWIRLEELKIDLSGVLNFTDQLTDLMHLIEHLKRFYTVFMETLDEIEKTQRRKGQRKTVYLLLPVVLALLIGSWIFLGNRIFPPDNSRMIRDRLDHSVYAAYADTSQYRWLSDVLFQIEDGSEQVATQVLNEEFEMDDSLPPNLLNLYLLLMIQQEQYSMARDYLKSYRKSLPAEQEVLKGLRWKIRFLK